MRDVSQAEPLTELRAQRRQSLLKTVDGLAERVAGNDQIKAFDQFQQRATEMVLSGEARDAFAIDKEDDKLRNRYGRTTFGQSCLLARRLIERGVTFVTVNSGGWDHHAKIWDGLDRMLPDFDRGFSALIDDMQRAVARAGRAESLRRGLRVVFAGAPNTGKSSLLNALAQRDVAIVSPLALSVPAALPVVSRSAAVSSKPAGFAPRSRVW